MFFLETRRRGEGRGVDSLLGGEHGTCRCDDYDRLFFFLQFGRGRRLVLIATDRGGIVRAIAVVCVRCTLF